VSATVLGTTATAILALATTATAATETAPETAMTIAPETATAMAPETAVATVTAMATETASKTITGPETATVQVVVRLRPINEREKKHGTIPVVTASSKDKTVTVVKGSGHRQARLSYSFDNVFSAFSSQEEVFQNTLRPILIDVMQGFESTVFAYGQTGTGKTHTMEGELSSPKLHGVIPRSAESIFTTLSRPEYVSHSVTCSCLEIYNEELCDLLADEEEQNCTKVEIMEGKDGIFCRGQIEKEVHSAEDVLTLMCKAQQYRKIGETKMNKQSSRSHCLFTLKINAKKVLSDGNSLEVHGKLHLVDLAGSECAKTASGRGTEVKRDRERSNINKSLLTLGRVIIMLKEKSEGRKTMRIPYRDSKLTRLLQKSLGGKCKTLVIATLSPSISSIEESISTLNYAQSANGIVNKPVAQSFLSINSSGAPPNIPTSSEGATDGQTLEHWYEMECRLQYMQTQVEEAQAALARNYMVQQEVVDRADVAERLAAEMEKKYEDAKKQIRGLEEDAVEQKKQKDAIALTLKQTETQLKRTTLSLEATQKTEVRLTAEATALIKTVQESISDGDQLHQCVLDAREADVQKRSATRKFHSTTATALEDITTSLNNLSRREEEYRSTIVESAEKGNKSSHQSLDQSLKVMKEIITRATALTSTIKSHAQDEKGIMPLMLQISEHVQDEVGQSKDLLVDGEGTLCASFQTGQKQIKKYSTKLKNMEAEYVTSTERLLSSLNKNFSQSKEKVLSMVASITNALSSVRDANSETRNVLNIVISKLEKESIEAATHIKDVSKTQSAILTNEIDSFSNGMQHIGNTKIKLKEQVDFIDTDGTAHLNDIKTQKSVLSNQQDSIIKAKKEQKIMEDEFLATVLNGVTSLVNEQMGLLSKKQTEYLKSFEKSNQTLVEKNNVICTSADNILDEVKGANQTISENIEHAAKNDSSMKAIAEDAHASFVSIHDTSKQQHNTITTNVSKANTRMTELSVQDESVANTSNKMQIERDVIVERARKIMQDEKNEVEILTDAAKKQSAYTSNTVLANVLANLVSMEKPRKKLITNISGKLDHIGDTVKEGKAQIDIVAKKQCSTADKFRREVESKHNDYSNKSAKRSRTEFDACKISIVTNAKGHLETSAVDLSSSTSHVLSTKKNVEDFATNTIQSRKSVSPVEERRTFIYSLNLSATDAIIKPIRSSM